MSGKMAYRVQREMAIADPTPKPPDPPEEFET
jgi:hypothetical protein